jgi:hypothetical protein
LVERIRTLEEELRNKESALGWTEVDDIGCNGARQGHEGSCVSRNRGQSGVVHCPPGSIEMTSGYHGQLVKHACYMIHK